MGVANTLMGSTEMDSEVDLIDVLAIVLLGMFSPILFGVYSWQIEVFGGYDFNQALWTLGGVDVSVTFLVIIFSASWILLTNFVNGETDIDGYEAAVVIVTIALPILYVFIPAVESLVTWHDLTRLMAVLWVTVGATYVSYVG